MNMTYSSELGYGGGNYDLWSLNDWEAMSFLWIDQPDLESKYFLISVSS